MWSLYRQRQKGNFLGEFSGEYLKPLVFSNGKSQEDIVQEVVSSVRNGVRVVFIKGVCGSGKSAVALNIAKELGRASIVVPIKSLQKQYEEDYTDKKYVLGNDKRKLKIKVITGRQNHKCPFEGCQADNKELPCTIEIKKSNIEKIKEYLEQNEFIDIKNFKSMQDIKRISIASICPYWCPIVPAYREIGIFEGVEKIRYNAIRNAKYSIYKRQPGCSYCRQFESYADADVLIFNSKKYLLETFLERKPATDVEIIDECDEFLDSFSNERNVNLQFLKTSIENLDENIKRRFEKLAGILDEILEADETGNLAQAEDVFKLENTNMHDLFSEMLNIDIEELVDEENYIFKAWETAKMFEKFLGEAYFSFFEYNGRIWARIICLNLGKIFQELLDRNKAFVLMSGTIHSEKVLKEVFGLQSFKIIEAEAKLPGKVFKQMTGREIDCNYKKMKSNEENREKYLKALSNCLSIAERPVVINITSFWDLPNEKEIEKFDIDNLMTREKLSTLQDNDKTGEIVKRFKNKEMNVLFTTKCNRGIDFPGDVCKSIIMTKYPFPDISSIFWKVLKKEKPEIYNEFYIDKAKREFLQRVYRAVRFKEDKVTLLSPDIRVFQNSGLFA
jgi:hypothetical protein